MKHLYDGTAKDPDFQIGLQVWLYTPRRRKGLSPKLMHNWHGPFRFISKLSEGHLCLRTLDNNLVTTAVHANHMKLYHDPNDRPILLPDVDNVDDQYLKNSDLPPESFTAVNDMDEKADPSSSTSRASELNHEKDTSSSPPTNVTVFQEQNDESDYRFHAHKLKPSNQTKMCKTLTLLYCNGRQP